MEYLLYAKHFAVIKNNGTRSYCVGTTYHITMAFGARRGEKHLLASSHLVFTTSLGGWFLLSSCHRG